MVQVEVLQLLSEEEGVEEPLLHWVEVEVHLQHLVVEEEQLLLLLELLLVLLSKLGLPY